MTWQVVLRVVTTTGSLEMSFTNHEIESFHQIFECIERRLLHLWFRKTT
jgi:hypothetical protein